MIDRQTSAKPKVNSFLYAAILVFLPCQTAGAEGNGFPNIRDWTSRPLHTELKHPVFGTLGGQPLKIEIPVSQYSAFAALARVNRIGQNDKNSPVWNECFSIAEQDAALQICKKMKGKNSSSIVSILGIPAFKGPTPSTLPKSFKSDEILVYFFGGCKIPAFFKIRGKQCFDSNIFSLSEYEDFASWQRKRLKAFALNRKLFEVIHVFGSPLTADLKSEFKQPEAGSFSGEVCYLLGRNDLVTLTVQDNRVIQAKGGILVH